MRQQRNKCLFIADLYKLSYNYVICKLTCAKWRRGGIEKFLKPRIRDSAALQFRLGCKGEIVYDYLHNRAV